MDQTTIGNEVVNGGHRAMAGEKGGDFSASLGATTSGRLVFASGVSQVRLRVEGSMPDLYRAHFGGRSPEVLAEDGTVTIRYGRFPVLGWLYSWGDHPGEVRLNGSIPWQIEIRGGVSTLDGDLGGLQLSGLEIEGGATKVNLTLPRPVGAVSVRLLGGASDVTILRPTGAAARLEVDGGATKLTFDRQQLGAVGGGSHWETSDYAGATDRYDIRIAGGASTLTVDAR